MFNLEVDINTDDDAELFYNGKLFCFYGPDLNIRKKFPTRKEAISHLREIKVIAGGKLSAFLVELFQDAAKHLQENDEFYSSGNHEIEIEIYEDNNGETMSVKKFNKMSNEISDVVKNYVDMPSENHSKLSDCLVDFLLNIDIKVEEA